MSFAAVRRSDAARLRAAERIGGIDAEKLAASKPHGTRVKYVAGCKCMLCRAANSQYEVGRAIERKAGNWNGIVSAEPARLHLVKLSRGGVGRRAVADAADVSKTILSEIRRRTRLKIRQGTERKILGVTLEAASDGAYIDAGRAWVQMNELLREGFTRTELARRLGSKAKVPALQFGRDSMTARNVAQVDKLYRTLMRE